MNEDAEVNLPPLSGRREAAEELAAGRAPSAAGYQAMRQYLQRSLQLRSGISPTEAADIVDESIAKLVEAAAADRIRAGSALAYLKRIIRNEAIDRMRRDREDPSEIPDFAITDDDSIARLIDGHASAQGVESAIREAIAARDYTCVHVTTEYLVLAADGQAPTLRAVAERCNISHTGVRLALDRLRAYLRDH